MPHSGDGRIWAQVLRAFGKFGGGHTDEKEWESLVHDVHCHGAHPRCTSIMILIISITHWNPVGSQQQQHILPPSSPVIIICAHIAVRLQHFRNASGQGRLQDSYKAKGRAATLCAAMQMSRVKVIPGKH